MLIKLSSIFIFNIIYEPGLTRLLCPSKRESRKYISDDELDSCLPDCVAIVVARLCVIPQYFGNGFFMVFMV
ncbi:MAG: hypothetical protein V1833_04755 [Elusimicrobiota bacterium]